MTSEHDVGAGDGRTEGHEGRADAVCPWRSLGPGRGAPRTVEALADACAGGPEVRAAVAAGLGAVEASMKRSFPHNLYGDLDFLATVLARDAEAFGPSAAGATAARIAALHDAFGNAATLQFRYVHDFLYGFDWARWVAGDPMARADVGPFDEAFLTYVERRAGELRDLVVQDDAKYGRLAKGIDRNPFGFARDPRSEARLLESLAERGWIPVEAWRADASPRWDRPYAEERRRRACALGLTR